MMALEEKFDLQLDEEGESSRALRSAYSMHAMMEHYF